MSRLVAAALAVLLAPSSPAPLRSPIVPTADYATIPASPAEFASQVSACKVTLAEAAGIAAKAGEGVVGSIQVGGPKGAPVYEVGVFGASKSVQVVVDAATGAVASKKEVARFPGDPTTGDWVETASGLKYFELRAGTGPKPPTPEATVTVHYTGWYVDGRKFDSSVDRGEPTTLPLSMFIQGWAEGVAGMKVGGKRKLVVPPAIGYANRPPPGIQPNATLVFDVELLAIPN